LIISLFSAVVKINTCFFAKNVRGKSGEGAGTKKRELCDNILMNTKTEVFL
jgi:hypothetical protein